MSWRTSFFYPHKVLVRDAISAGGMGSGHGDSREVVAEVLDEQHLVRTADGVEVVSSTRVTVPLAANVPVGSLVTVWPGDHGEREATVLVVGRDVNMPPLPSHLVLSLT